MSDLQVHRIDPAETYQWLKRKHYAKRIPSIIHAYGLYRGSELIGVVTYGMPPSPSLCEGVCGPDHKSMVIELNRLCCENSKNSASILVGRSLQMLPKPSVVVSYADTGQGHVGYIYQATNFIYTGLTDSGRKTPRADRISISGKHGRHEGRLNDGTVDASISLVYRKPKHRYIFFCGDKRSTKKLRLLLNYPALPYPKGESTRYDASAEVLTQTKLF